MGGSYEDVFIDQRLQTSRDLADSIRERVAEAYADGIPLTEDFLRDNRPEVVIADYTRATPEELASSDATSAGEVLYAVSVSAGVGKSSFYGNAGATLNGWRRDEAHVFSCADITVTYEAKPRTAISNGTCPRQVAERTLSEQYSLIDAATGEVLQRPQRP